MVSKIPVLLLKQGRYFASFGLGVLLVLTQEPFNAVPFIVCLTGLLLVLDMSGGYSKKKVFMLGWFFGLGFHVAGLYWICVALGVDMSQFWWLVPFTVLGLPAFFGLWTGGALLLTHISGFQGLRKAVLFAVLFSLAEWGRGHALTGFPWNLLGYTWLCSDQILQVTSIIGIYGLTALTVLLGCVPYGFIKERKIAAPLAVLAIFGGMWVYGYGRLQDHPTLYHPDVTLRIVQPNIPQELKWDVEKITENYRKILNLSRQPSKEKITHVIWPESAIPFYLEEDQWHRQEIMKALPTGATLITGGLRREMVKGALVKIWNSLLVVGPSQEVVATYDKFHLVPFGEYVPLRAWIPSLVRKVTYGSVDFSPGKGPQTLTVPHSPPFSPLVCYEGIFPGDVVGAPRPQWIINVTNDAWYGDTSGPHQHFGSVRVRAIEEGLPLARVANTGISGLFDGVGRVLQSLPLDGEGIIDAQLPLPLSHPTLFSYLRDWSFFLIIFLLILGSRPWKKDFSRRGD